MLWHTGSSIWPGQPMHVVPYLFFQVLWYDWVSTSLLLDAILQYDWLSPCRWHTSSSIWLTQPIGPAVYHSCDTTGLAHLSWRYYPLLSLTWPMQVKGYISANRTSSAHLSWRYYSSMWPAQPINGVGYISFNITGLAHLSCRYYSLMWLNCRQSINKYEITLLPMVSHISQCWSDSETVAYIRISAKIWFR